MVNKMINLTLRALEFFWTLLVMCLIGNVIAMAGHGTSSVVNWQMFVVSFSILSLIYLVAAAFNEGFSGHPLIPVAVDTLNTLFFFCGAVALAAKLGAHSCSNEGYTLHNSVTNSAPNHLKKTCQETQAATAFLFFGWASYTASMVFSALSARQSGVNLRSGGVRKGAPAMSQV